MADEIEQPKIAAGAYHTCLIGKKIGKQKGEKDESRYKIDRLYVWGLNADRVLSDDARTTLDEPTEVKLECFDREYEPVSVVTGSTFTAVIGRINLKKEEKYLLSKEITHGNQMLGSQSISQMMKNQTKQTRGPSLNETNLTLIQKHFRAILLEQKTLIDLFETHDQEKDNIKVGEEKKKVALDENVLASRARKKWIDKNKLISVIKKEFNNDPKNRQGSKSVQTNLEEEEIADCITPLFKQRSGQDSITLMQFEDFCLNFQQDSTRLFIFGKCDENLLAKPQVENNEAFKQDSDAEIRFQIRSKPTVIQFGRFVKPITQVSCGHAHMLALTTDNQMFSWGDGQYGALGFGDTNDVSAPKLLEIDTGIKQQIWKVACGKMHSMCLTTKKQVFTWGQGIYGKLGHGNEDDQFLPKEVKTLTNLRPIDISAGDAHSAVIVQSRQLYVWGNGFYGRLGSGFELKELLPIQVEDMSGKEVVKVSCGALHTLVLTSEGKIWAFGHDKYGKLGLGRTDNLNQVQPQLVRIFDDGKQQDHEFMMCDIVAGQNHSLALKLDKKKSQLFTWGYKGYGLLMRKEKDNQSPYVIDVEFKIKTPGLSKQLIRVKDRQARDMALSTKIAQVQCALEHTVVLLQEGEVYMSGTSETNSLMLEDDRDNDKNRDGKQFKQINYFTLKYPNQKVVQIACGQKHMFVLLDNGRAYGWGANDEGQLGLDNTCEQTKPAEIQSLLSYAIKKIFCGNKHTAILTENQTLLVAGSQQYGRLGNQRSSSRQQTFQINENLQLVKRVACGTDHMIVICEGTEKKFLAWGRNDKGQLGIGNKQHALVPTQISMENVEEEDRFKKFVCGKDFSLGLCTTGNLYVWGNRWYLGQKESKENRKKDQNELQDEDEPKREDQSHIKGIKDIHGYGSYIILQTDESKFYFIGEFQRQKSDKDRTKQYSWENSVDITEEEHKNAKFKFALGPNHAISIINKEDLYGWGSANQLGIVKDGQDIAKPEPIKELNEFIQENIKTLQMRDGKPRRVKSKKESSSCESSDNDLSRSNSSDSDNQSDKSSKSKSQKDEESKEDISAKNKVNKKETKEEKQKKQKDEQPEKQTVLEKNGGIKGADIRKKRQEKNKEEQQQERRQQEKSNEEQERRFQQFQISEQKYRFEEQHCLLQKELKDEEKLKMSDKFLFEQDTKLRQTIEKMLVKQKKLINLDKERKFLITQSKCSFMQRITEKPFKQNESGWYNYCYDEPLLKNMKNEKRHLKEILKLVHVHPCYLQNLFLELFGHKNNNPDRDNDFALFRRFLKQVYPNDFVNNVDSQKFLKVSNLQEKKFGEIFIDPEKERVNFLMISFAKRIIDNSVDDFISKNEKKQDKKNDKSIQFCEKENIVSTIFQRIFISQEANMDSLAKYATYVIQKYIETFGQGEEEDKGKKGDKIIEKCFQFVQEHMIKDLIEGRYTKNKLIISNQKDSFDQKPDNKKKQEQVRPFIFSTDVNVLIKMIYDAIKKATTKLQRSHEETVENICSCSRQILSLIFLKPFRKMIENFEIYVFPYMKGSKAGNDILRNNQNDQLHPNMQIILSIFECYIKNEDFQKCRLKEQRQLKNEAAQSIQAKIEQLISKTKDKFLDTVVIYNQWLTLQYKNFENMILHSLSNSDFMITVDTNVVEKMIEKLQKHKEKVMIVMPSQFDPLQIKIAAYESSKAQNLKLGQKETKEKELPERYYLKIKSRLLLQTSEGVEAQCCPQCSAVLTSDLVVSETKPIFESYDPENQDTLFSLYGKVLKFFPALKQNVFILDQLKEKKNDVRENNEKDLIVMQRFETRLTEEMAILKNNEEYRNETIDKNLDKYRKEIHDRQAFDKSKGNNQPYDNIIKYRILQNLKDLLVNKLNQRRKHLETVSLSVNRMECFLDKRIKQALKIDKVKEDAQHLNIMNYPKLFYMATIYHHQLGLANLELKKMCKIVDNLVNMRKIFEHQKKQQFSPSLFKVLQEPQKMEIRAVKRTDASELLRKKTINKVMDELKPLINDCVLSISETEDRQIEIRLLHEEKKLSCVGTKSKVDKQRLLYTILIDQKRLYGLRKEVRQHSLFENYFKEQYEKCKESDKEDKNMKELRRSLGFSEKTKKKGEIKNKNIAEQKQKMQKDLLKKNMISFPNGLTDENMVLQFNKAKLLKLINEMLNNRFAYVFNCNKTPVELVKQWAIQKGKEDDDDTE